MEPRIEYYAVRLRGDAGPRIDHWEAVYLDSTGKELYHTEHQEHGLLAFSALQHTMKQAGFLIEDLPKPHEVPPRYLG